jgi:integrase
VIPSRFERLIFAPFYPSNFHPFLSTNVRIYWVTADIICVSFRIGLPLFPRPDTRPKTSKMVKIQAKPARLQTIKKPRVTPFLKSEPSPSGKHQLMLLITFGNERGYMSLSEQVTWEDFNHDKDSRRCFESARAKVTFWKRVEPSYRIESKECDPRAKSINNTIETHLNIADAIIERMEIEARLSRSGQIDTSAQAIKTAIAAEMKRDFTGTVQVKSIPTNDVSFFDFAFEQSEEVERSGSVGLAKRYRSAALKLQKWLLEKRGKDTLLISEMTKKLITDYDHYLSHELKNLETTKYTSLRLVKTLYNRALKQRPPLAAMENPFANMVLNRGESKKVEKLSKGELKAMAALDLSDPREGLARDIFLFCVHADGMRIMDALIMRKECYSKREDTLTYLPFKGRNKTRRRKLVVELDNVTRGIIEKYMKKDSPFIFPFLGEHHLLTPRVLYNACSAWETKLNRALKRVQAKMDLDIRLSTHVARHTFAALYYNETKDVYALQKKLGHSSIAITQAYLEGMGFTEEDKTFSKNKGWI